MQTFDARRDLLDKVVAKVEGLQLCKSADRFRNDSNTITAERKQMQAVNAKNN